MLDFFAVELLRGYSGMSGRLPQGMTNIDIIAPLFVVICFCRRNWRFR